MNTTLRALAAGILLGLPALAGATQVAFHPLLEQLAGCTESLNTRAAADLDGDGRKDLVTGCGAGSDSPMISILGLDAARQLVVKHAWMLPYDDARWPPLAWRDTTGGHVGIVRADGLEHWSGWPPRREGFVPFAGSAPVIDPATTIIADLDGDGVAEMPVLARNPLRIDTYSIPSGALRWSLPIAALGGSNHRLEVLQLDTDPALELLVRDDSGSRFAIVDGATRAVDYHSTVYAGIGNAVAGRLLPGSGGLLDTRGDRWSLYRTTPWQELWWWRQMFPIGTPSVADIDGDGIDEIVFRGSGADAADIMGMKATGAAARRVAGAGDSSGFDLADIDDDGRAEILTNTYGTPGPCALSAWDGVTATVRFRLEYACRGQSAGPFVPGGSGDLILQRHDPERSLIRVNAVTGAVVWAAARDPAVQGGAQAIAWLERGGDGHPEVAMSVSGDDYGWIVLHDGATGTHKRTLQIGGPGMWVAPRDFAVRTDTHGVPYSFVTCMSDGRVREFRYDNGTHLWTMPDVEFGCTNVWFDDGTIVANGRNAGLVAYEADTHQLRWQTPSGLVSWQFMPISQAGSSTQYLFVEGTDVHVFDPSSQQVVRSFALPDSIDGFDIADIVLPPGGDLHGLVVRTRRGVAVIDGVTGELRAEVGNLAYHDPRRGALSVGATATPGRYLVGVVGNSPWWTFALDLPPDRIFAGGFDP